MNTSFPSPRLQVTAGPPAPPRADLCVHFVPRWPKNPYHAQLARHLDDCGVDVGEESRLKEIARARHSPRAAKREILHLHAVPSLHFGPVRLARFIAFWWRIHRLRADGVKLVWTVHNVADHESAHPLLDRLVLRWWYRRADAVILHSLGARALVESQWRVRRTRNLFIVHHGHFIDCYPATITRAAARRRFGIPERELVFLFLGTIRPYKGVRALVREFKATASAGMRLVIAGETLSEELRGEIAADIAGSPAISFHPRYVSDAEVQDFMSAADVVVFPYTRTLTSGALVLAMSFGRACIAPDVGALADTLDPAGGFLFDPAEADGLRGALVAAMARRDGLAAMGLHNRTRAGQWGWDKAAALTARAYEAAFNEFR